MFPGLSDSPHSICLARLTTPPLRFGDARLNNLPDLVAYERISFLRKFFVSNLPTLAEVAGPHSRLILEFLKEAKSKTNYRWGKAKAR